MFTMRLYHKVNNNYNPLTNGKVNKYGGNIMDKIDTRLFISQNGNHFSCCGIFVDDIIKIGDENVDLPRAHMDFEGTNGVFICSFLNRLFDRLNIESFANESVEDIMTSALDENHMCAVHDFANVVLADTENVGADTQTRALAYDISEDNNFKLAYNAEIHMNQLNTISLNPLTLISHINESYKTMSWLKQEAAHDNFKRIVSRISKSGLRTKIYKSFEVTGLWDAILIALSGAVESNTFIKICPLCGKYFVPEKSNSRYCSYPSIEDPTKSCSEYIKYTKYLEKNRSDEATRLYKQIYNLKRNRLKNASTQVTIEDDLKEFMMSGEKWRNDVKSGLKSEKEYIEWLKNVKEGLLYADNSKKE